MSPNILITSSYYLQQKHVLLIHCNMKDFLVDYYLSQKNLVPKPSPEQDYKLKQLLAGAALHITVRSPEESVAWTVLMHDQEPYSLFVTASPSEKILVGQVLKQNIRHSDVNVFHSQITRSKGKSSLSSIKSESSDIEKMLESFYTQSEQLPLKVSLLSSSDESLALVGMPEVDLEWFNEQSPKQVYQELDKYKHKLMKNCQFSFTCNCSVEKLLPYLRSIEKNELLELYGEDELIVVNCPRCGNNFSVERNKILS